MGALVEHYSLIPADVWHWPDFTPKELACSCCGEFYWEPEGFNWLQAGRDKARTAFIINSAHRCGIHNARVGGVPLSSHRHVAWDISLRGHDRHELLSCLQSVGFSTFGYYETFIHTDLRPGRRWYGSAEARRLWNS